MYSSSYGEADRSANIVAAEWSESRKQNAAGRMSITSILNDSSDEEESSSTSSSSILSPLSSAASLSPSISESSLSSDPTSKRRRRRSPRKPCHKYTREQEHFIWYHRTDLQMPWDQVEYEYKRYFNHQGDDFKGGLQCKYYRILDFYNVQKVRQQTRSGRFPTANKVAKYGLLETVKCCYPWIRPPPHRV